LDRRFFGAWPYDLGLSGQEGVMNTNSERLSAVSRPTIERLQTPELHARSLREVVNDKPILVFSGLAILWSALFLLN
jgi:hypothetical protein